MKYLILVLALLSAPAFADDKEEVCNNFQSLARTAMSARQADMDPMDLINGLGENESTQVMYTFGLLVGYAYSLPVEDAREDKERAVRDFVTDAYLECHK